MVVKPLSELSAPDRGRIIKVGGSGEIRRRLLDMGVVAGSVEVQRVAPLGDPVQIRIKGYDLALRKEEARKIHIEVTGGLLSRMAAGQEVTVTDVRAGWGLRRRLAGLGIETGARAAIVKNGHPGPVIIEIRGSPLSLGYGVASKIIVRVNGTKNA